MSDIESRLKHLEDRVALQEVLVALLTAIDSLSKMDELLGCFTQSAVFDLSALNLPRLEGHAGIHKFFSRVFADTTYLAHFVTNFRVVRVESNEADCRAYVTATWKSRSGVEALACSQYDLSYVRSGECWMIRSFVERTLMPIIRRSTDPGIRT